LLNHNITYDNMRGCPAGLLLSLLREIVVL
jgi:hypothetical protein